MATDSDKIKQLPDGRPLQRYGLRWKDASSFVCEPMENGYWTPWHIAEERIAALVSELETAKRALEFYAENGRLCRLIHQEGDVGRNALAADGGKIAQAALKSE